MTFYFISFLSKVVNFSETMSEKPSYSVIVVEEKMPPVLPKLLLHGDFNDGTASLTWSNISDEHETFNYQLIRRIKGKGWEPFSSTDGKERIRVLNVYPPEGNYLETWMDKQIGSTGETAGKGLFKIVSVPLVQFNEKG